MKRKRFSEEQIIALLKESEAGAKAKETMTGERTSRWARCSPPMRIWPPH